MPGTNESHIRQKPGFLNDRRYYFQATKHVLTVKCVSWTGLITFYFPGMISYHNKTFRSVSNTDNGEVGAETVFNYQQQGSIVTATYAGGSIATGHLIAIADADGALDMRYHHVNKQGVLMTGICRSVPEILPDGRIRLHESWQWTSGDHSSGTSEIEQIPDGKQL